MIEKKRKLLFIIILIALSAAVCLFINSRLVKPERIQMQIPEKMMILCYFPGEKDEVIYECIADNSLGELKRRFDFKEEGNNDRYLRYIYDNRFYRIDSPKVNRVPVKYSSSSGQIIIYPYRLKDFQEQRFRAVSSSWHLNPALYCYKGGSGYLTAGDYCSSDEPVFCSQIFNADRSTNSDIIGNYTEPFGVSAHGFIVLNARYKPNQESGALKYVVFEPEPRIENQSREERKESCVKAVNPSGSPDGRNISFYLAGDKGLGMYFLNTERKLSSEEITNWDRVVRILRNEGKSPVLYLILSYFDKESMQVVNNFQNSGSLSNDDKKIIIGSLNRFVENSKDMMELAYDDRFDNLPILCTNMCATFPIATVLSNHTANRLVLEAFFGDSLKKSSVPFKLSDISGPENSDTVLIPQKRWSPDGKKILFSRREANNSKIELSIADISKGTIEKVMEFDSYPGSGYPGMEWTSAGIVLTYGTSVFLNTKSIENPVSVDFREIRTPEGLNQVSNGTLSPCGNKLMFTGKSSEGVSVYVCFLPDETIYGRQITKAKGRISDVQGTWIPAGANCIIRNEQDAIEKPVLKKLKIMK